jgi:hypothetical protein
MNDFTAAALVDVLRTHAHRRYKVIVIQKVVVSRFGLYLQRVSYCYDESWAVRR